jgi:hypothetical protein
MGSDLERKESSSRNIEGKIKKAVQAPTKFDIVQQKKFPYDAQRALQEEKTCEYLKRTTWKALEEA